MPNQHGIPNGTGDKSMGAMDFEKDRVGAPRTNAPRPARPAKFPPKAPVKRPTVSPRKY